MAGNEWINGYLEAILDSGGGAAAIEDQKAAAAGTTAGERGHFNPTTYFVEEVVKSVDESDLHRTWIRVAATRDSRERGARLENMCWRVWHLTRKKKQLEWEEMQRTEVRKLEREKGRLDATEDMSEEVSESEKGEEAGGDTPRFSFQRCVSNLEPWPVDHDERKLYIVLISLHGLVRGENMELGRDSDTGGQVKYVVELSRALAQMPGVYRVDLFTRQMSSPEVDWSYGEPTEMLTPGGDGEGAGESGGSYIIRIPFGPPEKYLKKEALWPYIQEFVDGALVHILNMSRVLGEQVVEGRPVWPYVIHGHYADAGDSAALLSGALNVPMVLTGHSLGRNKLEQLLKQGRQTKEDINEMYKIMRRIEAEELSLDAAELVITSTKQEVEEQWGLYHGFDFKLEKVLRARTRRNVHCHGRYMPRMAVIPPGMDFSSVDTQDEGDGEVQLTGIDGSSPKVVPAIWLEVMRFLVNPHKPMILALSRPDPKKNITTLINAFGECRPLRELANLVLIMGNRGDIDEMSSGNSTVLTTTLKLIDKHDLYGQVAYPKHHKQSDVPDIYKLAAKTKGVFINPALVEPFGLTLIEAAAHGLPMVATKNGGPVDIHHALKNGLLVDPHDQEGIAEALLKLVSEKTLWAECRRNGWKNIHLFSWPEHCRTYLSRIGSCRMRHPQWRPDSSSEHSTDVATRDSFNDSLVDDASLRLSIDAGGEGEVPDQVRHILTHMRESEPSPPPELWRPWSLRRGQKLVVVAVDCYDEGGWPGEGMVWWVQEAVRAGAGVAVSTAMPYGETVEVLRAGGVEAGEVDVLICGSGSEVYYRRGDGVPDVDYGSHIEYRWGCEGLRKTIWRVVNEEGCALEEDVGACNKHCISYRVRDRGKAKRVDDMRQKLRMRGLRCHLMYCRTSTRLQVIPLLASRAQALRYLFVRWGIEMGNMYVILGERGDTDYEELRVGAHKTIVVRGAVTLGSDELLSRGTLNYTRDDLLKEDNPMLSFLDHGSDALADTITRMSKGRF